MKEYGNAVIIETGHPELTDEEEQELWGTLDYNFKRTALKHEDLADYCRGKDGQLWELRKGPTYHPVECPTPGCGYDDALFCRTPDEHKVLTDQFIHQRGWYVLIEEL